MKMSFEITVFRGTHRCQGAGLIERRTGIDHCNRQARTLAAVRTPESPELTRKSE